MNSEEIWPVKLFEKSVLKQTKYKYITRLLGPTDNLHCFDIGSDNGVFCYKLRQQGGTWRSADLDARSVRAMKELARTDVFRIDGDSIPFEDNEFDCVVIVDFLEHIPNDSEFISEIYRVLKPGGTLILNAPHVKPGSCLMRFREFIGLTEEEHGHVRPGYTLDTINALLENKFVVETFDTHTKFFSKFTDTMLVWGLSFLKRNKKEQTSGRGILVTGKDLDRYKKMFRVYSLIYPMVWLFSKLDQLLINSSGYMLIAKATIIK